MIAKIEKLARDLRADYGQIAGKALDKIRAATLDTADLIAKTKDPVRKIADTSLKLNRISHKGVEKLVKTQARFVESTIDDGSRRLELAAKADSLRALFGDQIATLPQSRERAMTNARKTIDVVRDTGDEFGGVLKVTLGELQATMTAGAHTARSLVARQAAEAEVVMRNAVAETEKAIGRQAARVRQTAGEIETTTRKTAAKTKRAGTRKMTRAEADVKKATAEVKKAARKAARPASRKKAAPKRKAAAKKAGSRKATARKVSAKKAA
jgi:phasin family protein